VQPWKPPKTRRAKTDLHKYCTDLTAFVQTCCRFFQS